MPGATAACCRLRELRTASACQTTATGSCEGGARSAVATAGRSVRRVPPTRWCGAAPPAVSLLPPSACRPEQRKSAEMPRRATLQDAGHDRGNPEPYTRRPPLRPQDGGARPNPAASSPRPHRTSAPPPPPPPPARSLGPGRDAATLRPAARGAGNGNFRSRLERGRAGGRPRPRQRHRDRAAAGGGSGGGVVLLPPPAIAGSRFGRSPLLPACLPGREAEGRFRPPTTLAASGVGSGGARALAVWVCPAGGGCSSSLGSGDRIPAQSRR